MHVVLRRAIRVDLPPDRALHLFTPVGERLWVDEWTPRFPAGEEGDGAAVGTVFVTDGPHGQTFWTVVARTDDVVRYARATPGLWAGLVEVHLAPDPDGATRAEVIYELTALEESARAHLEHFAARYEGYIGEWEQLIARAITSGAVPSPPPA